MVLSYFELENKPPLILDSLSYKILDLEKRVDLKLQIFINQTGAYKIDENNTLVKVGDVPEKFKELMKKVEEDS